MIRRFIRGVEGALKRHWRRALLICLGGLLIPLTIAQFLYPANTLLPFTSVDGINVSGWNKVAAARSLDSHYADTPVAIYFGADSTAPYRSPKPAEIGITVNDEQRVAKMDYPWYLRLAPGSLLWGHFVITASDSPLYKRDSTVLVNYIKKELGESCSIEPKNADLKVIDSKVVVERGSPGGTCNLDEVSSILSNVSLNLLAEVKATIPITVIPAEVNNVDAQQLADEITQGIVNGIEMVVGSETVLLPRDQLISWLDFAKTDGKLDYSFNADRANDYLTKQLAAKVARSPGVTKISTYDFVETSRQTGAAGQALDVPATLANLKKYIAGDVEQAVVATAVIAPTVQYVRSYSPTYEGLASLMQNFATSHPGTYGVSLIELSGQYRRASYAVDKTFTTASTYKLFVAYSTLLRIESGAWHWTDQVHGGRDLTKCFDDMIVVSDNECAHALLDRIGFTNITNEARAIGCIHTSFLGSDGIKSTAGDLALLLAQLQTGQILSQQSSRDILISAMKRNIYRQGIPKGESGTVADKVGFLDGLLHDAAIVYSSTGPYILVIMTDGSSWANIAELTRQIEALRLQ